MTPQPAAARALPAVEARQLERLLRTTPVAWLISTLGALICYGVFTAAHGSASLDLWFITFCLVSSARLLAARVLLSRGRAVEAVPRWAPAWHASTLLHAAQWGLLPVALQGPGPAQAESVLHITLVAIAMGGAVRLPGFPRVMAAHVLLVLGPLVLRDLGAASASHALTALLVALIAAYALVSGRNQARALREIETQRERNEALIVALQRENARSEAARRAAEEASAARTRFFAAANHDLRQPLHAMGLLAQTLRERRPGVDVADTARHIGDCVEGMASVIDGLLEITRLDGGHLAPQWSAFALDELVQACCRPQEPLARAKGLQLHVAVPAVWVRSDRDLLARVLSNLLSNAIRYTAQGTVQVTAAISETTVQVAVEDTGVGIHADDLPRIFDEFYQVGNPARDRRQGLGLGLATVQRLSDLLHLQVSVQSAPGRGSRFALQLPREQAPPIAPMPADPGRVADAPHGGRRVLLVEDDADSRAALADLLRSWGCDVHAAAGVQAALQGVRAGFRAEALVADLRLADGGSGLDAVKALREALAREVPALLVTGDAGSEQILRAREAQLAVMIKPVRPDRLRAFLGHAFAEVPQTGT